jgi:hypothetical protein
MMRHLKITLPFILFGPPIGFLAFLLGIALFDLFWTCLKSAWCLDYSKYELPHPMNGGSGLVTLISMGLVLSYVVGGVPALLVGLVSSFWHSRFGRLPVLISISAGLACLIAVVAYDFNSLYQNYNNNELFRHLPYHGPISAISEYEWRSFFGSSFGLLLACVAASWAGWKVAISKAWTEDKT